MKTTSNQTSPMAPKGRTGFMRSTQKLALLALLLIFLWICCSGLYAQTVTIIPVGTDYINKSVSFRVSWEGTTTPAGKVWVWIDFCPVDGGTPGGFSPATILEVNDDLGGDVDENSLNGRGFYVTQSPTVVTATLDIATAPFNWCAYGSGHAPAAEAQAGGGYKLTGTPPFTINGDTKELGYYFGAGTCITSITDLTEHPGGIIPAPPGIQLSTGSSSQTITENAALPVLKYTTTNASGATLTAGSFPDGVSGSWASNTYTISGTPTAAGTFNYTVTTTNNNGCTNVTATGKIVVNYCEHPDCSGTWSIGTMVWSGAFRNAASCKSVSKLTYRDIPPAEYVDTGTPYGYYYNWTCVSTYATELCPAPWRVPSIQDFAALITTEDGDPAREVRTRWGYPGICDTKNCDYDNSWGLFWCTECFGVCPAALVYALHVMPDRLWNTYRPASDGLQLRCVK